MSNPNAPGFNPGGIVDRYDDRDYKYAEIGFGTPPFDWSMGFDIEKELGHKIRIKDQGQSFSCGGQAWSYLAEVLESLATRTYEPRSAKFIYAQTYQKGGGSTGRDNAEIFVKQGVAREVSCPSYIASEAGGDVPTEAFITHGQDITDAIRTDALKDMSLVYAQVEPANMNEIARALRDSNGIILGIDGQDNGTWLSAFPKPPTRTVWRHWVYAGKAKMIDGVKHIGIANSWGVFVGDAGWQWLSEDYFLSGHVWSGWTHVLKTNILIPSFSYNFVLNLSFGQTGVDIQKLQTALQIDGEFPVNITPTLYYGDVTRRAVLAFRAKYKISSANDPLGKSVGPLTRAKLNLLFS